MRLVSRLPYGAPVPFDPSENVLVWLWELRDGTRAGVIEHAVAPRWELRLIRHKRVVHQTRYQSCDDLMTAAMAEHLKMTFST